MTARGTLAVQYICTKYGTDNPGLAGFSTSVRPQLVGCDPHPSQTFP